MEEKKLQKELEARGITRRDFIRYCGFLAVVTGLSESTIMRGVLQAVETSSGKPAVIWLEGQDCAGCTISLAGAMNPPVASLILDQLSIRYHETLMAGSGQVAEEAYRETVKKGGYILVVEGSIPEADDRFCLVGGRPFREIFQEAAGKAGAIIAVGACASFGGIPGATVSRGVGVGKVVKKPVINLSTCPVHTDHLVGTILYFLSTGKAPELDRVGRPKMYFDQLVHDNCRRRSYFDSEMFLKDWNDPKQRDWCLYEMGCKGPETNSDCATRRWNGGINSCIDCGAGCQGCAEPSFHARMSPLFTAEGEVSRRIMARKRAGLIPPKA